MQFPTKSAHLSRHASTSHHGRLLQDSGFTALVSDPISSESLGPTTTKEPEEWFFPLPMTATPYFGRHATPTGRTPVDPSTSLRPWPVTGFTLSGVTTGRVSCQTIPVLTAKELMATLSKMIDELWEQRQQRLNELCVLQKTFSQRSKLDDLVPRPATALWGPLWGSTRLHDSCLVDLEQRVLSSHGSIPIQQETWRGVRSARRFASWGLKPPTS